MTYGLNPMARVFKDKYIRRSFYVSLALILITFSIAYFSLKPIDHLLIIHFSAINGIDFLGDKYDVVSILLSSLAIFAINFFITSFFYQRSRIISLLLAFFNIFFTALILIAVAVIISIN